MELNDFIKRFSDIFEGTAAGEFNANTEFQNLAEWDSFMVITIIAMVDAEYGITIRGDDIRCSRTIEDVYRVAKGKMNV